MSAIPQFGVLLPHFGDDPSTGHLTEVASLAEELGFDSLWVRDHLYIPPENREHGGITEKVFLEAFQTLATVGAITDDITLGTGVANAHRRPLKLSQHFGTLNHLTDGGVICGVGAGTFRGEFEASDLPFDERGQMADETLDVLRQTFREANVSYDGEIFSFEDVTLNPRPGRDVPIWYGGLSPIAVKRAFYRADGWFPGRMTLEKLDERIELLESLEAEHDRTLDRGYVTIYNVAEDRERALSDINVEGLIDDVNAILREDYETVDDIEGSFVAGTPDDCVQQLDALIERGFDHVVLDMRHNFDDLEETLELTAEEVLPRLR